MMRTMAEIRKISGECFFTYGVAFPSFMRVDAELELTVVSLLPCLRIS